MYTVYSRNVKTGIERAVERFDNIKDAIKRVATLYVIQNNAGLVGDYYNYIREVK